MLQRFAFCHEDTPGKFSGLHQKYDMSVMPCSSATPLSCAACFVVYNPHRLDMRGEACPSLEFAGNAAQACRQGIRRTPRHARLAVATCYAMKVQVCGSFPGCSCMKPCAEQWRAVTRIACKPAKRAELDTSFTCAVSMTLQTHTIVVVHV